MNTDIIWSDIIGSDIIGSDIIGIIISHLDRCEDIKTAEEVYSFFDLANEEKAAWLKESHIESGKDDDIIPEWITNLIEGKISEYHAMNGKLHRENDLPAIIQCSFSSFRNIQQWWKNGKQHRDGDKPAYINLLSCTEWWFEGKLHRDVDENGLHLPARIVDFEEGYQEWFKNGQRLHEGRDAQGYSLPTRVYNNGSKEWLNNRPERFSSVTYRDEKDKEGRVLPAHINATMGQSWWIDGRQHRECKDDQCLTFPAYIGSDGDKRWYLNGALHRREIDEAGRYLPAWIYTDGSYSWWVDGVEVNNLLETIPLGV